MKPDKKKTSKNDLGKVEYLNLYDKNGTLLEEKGIRGQKNDNFFGIVIIFIENSKGEFLIQKTSLNRGSIYATTGGHVDYGYSFNDSIIKEVKEELGIDIKNDNIEEKYSYIWNHYFLKVYYLNKDINLSDISIQKDEVEFVQWMSKEKIDELINNNLFREGNIEGYKYIINHK